MTRVAIVGGGIAGLTAAYALEQRRAAGEPLEWYLYESSNRLGGTVHTLRPQTADGEYILEGGPDAWLTEKPWVRDLAMELGLGDDLVPSNDAGKITYIWSEGALTPLPGRMRMMVPETLEALEGSPLFSSAARGAYAAEIARAAELRRDVPQGDESVASFVLRHFGPEVLAKVAAPLLAGVFGGDVHKLSVEAVMPLFRRLEIEHGSLILGLQAQRNARGEKSAQAIFTTLRRGMGSLTEALVAALPEERLQRCTTVTTLRRSGTNGWLLQLEGGAVNACTIGLVPCDRLLLTTPIGVTRRLLAPVDAAAAALLPVEASSAVLVTFCWRPAAARNFSVPPGFGFLVPQLGEELPERPQLLAGTFTTQKFPHRAPPGARVLRVFFGGAVAQRLEHSSDSAVAQLAWAELVAVLPGLPVPEAELTLVVRWPHSLPQYEVGHLQRMAELQSRMRALGDITLLGNGYRGVGIPDLVRDAREAVAQMPSPNIRGRDRGLA